MLIFNCVGKAVVFFNVHVWYMYGTCMVHVWCMYGACMVHVWYMYGTCVHTDMKKEMFPYTQVCVAAVDEQKCQPVNSWRDEDQELSKVAIGVHVLCVLSIACTCLYICSVVCVCDVNVLYLWFSV